MSRLLDKIIEEVRALPPEEQQQLRDTVDSFLASSQRVEDSDLSQELRWLAEHREQYAGQWVALNGSELISSGADGVEVYETALRQGVLCPFLVQIGSPDELPFGGW